MKKIVLFILLSCIYLGAKGGIAPKKLEALKISNDIKVDGILSEDIWQSSKITKFLQRDPDEGAPATQQTEVWVAYDEYNIYVAAKLKDSNPSQIDKSLVRRDDMIDSDWFTFYVDPYLDKKTGYFFSVNAGGSIADGTMFNDDWDDSSWDGIWTSKTSQNGDGWCVELKIPFSQLRFKESKNMTWGINFSRSIKRLNEESYFIMVPRKESGFVSHFAELSGLDNIKVHQRIELLPYIVQKAQYLQHDDSDPFYGNNQYKTNFGADLKFSVGSNINVDATFNPDFGQVEVDPAVVNLTAFETSFPEKRPFFIEGRDIFRFGVGGSNNNWGFNFGTPNLFYSRRIGRSPQGSVSGADYVDYPRETRIIGAAKLTGKIDETWSVGGLTSFTERTYAELDNDGKRSNEEIEPFTHYGVLRTQKEFNDGKQGLGILGTTVNRNLRTTSLSDNLVENAFTLGLDGWTFLDEDEQYVITGSFVGSYVNGSKNSIARLQNKPYRYFQRPDAKNKLLDSSRTSLSGAYGRLMLNKQEGNWYINSALGFVTPGFEFNDLGLQYWSDKINAHIVGGYRWFNPDGIFRRKWIYVAHFRDYDFEGNLLSNGIMTFANFQFMNYYRFGINASYNFESYNKNRTRGGVLSKNPGSLFTRASLRSDGSKNLVVEVEGSYWKDKLGSYGYETSLDIEIKPTSAISISVGPSYDKNYENHQWVQNVNDKNAFDTYGVRSVFGRMNQETISGNIRVNWTFTPELSLQLFVQPLISVGSYNNFNELKKSRSHEYRVYGEEGTTISYNEDNDVYVVNPEANENSEEFYIYNPDFNFKSFRANMVLRWEVMPGSSFYFVWTHDRMNFQDAGDFQPSRDFRNLMKEEPDNIFMVKFSYWFNT